MFQRMQFIAEATGWNVFLSFAYRAALSPVLCALPCRWLVAFWLTRHGHLYVGDWDEKDAFCNTVRPGLGAVCWSLGMLEIAEWAEGFFGRFRVGVVTPFGLGRPYRMAHGGAQGDNMGVGLYGCMDGACLRFNQGVVDAAVDPSTFLPLASSLCLRAPWDARVWVLEVSFSDDRRLFGKTPDGLNRVLQANCHACWAAGGTPNAVKLKASASCWKVATFGMSQGFGTPTWVRWSGRRRACR